VTKVIDLWIDIGAANRDEAAARVRIGDPGVLDSRVEEYPNGRIVSRSLDNRIGAFVAAEAMRRLATARPKHAAVFSVASTREEIAWTGSGARTSAVGIEPDVAVVVDVTHATDYPGADKKHVGDHKLGGGVVLSRGSSVSSVVFDLLAECAEQAKIPYTIQAAPRDTGTDADAIYNAMRGIPTGLVSVPNRYMHSPNEMVALEDLDRAADLLAAFARPARAGNRLHTALAKKTGPRRTARGPELVRSASRYGFNICPKSILTVQDPKGLSWIGNEYPSPPQPVPLNGTVW